MKGVRLINPLAVDSQRNANNKMGPLVKENRKFYGKSGGKIRNLMPKPAPQDFQLACCSGVALRSGGYHKLSAR
jgi:hypothetical protein